MQPQGTLNPNNILKAQATSLSDQMNSVLIVAGLLEKGQRNTTRIMEIIGVSRPTAVKYVNEAIKILHQENKALNTEAMRHMEIGRLNYWIDWLQVRIEAEEDKEYRIKLLGRLDQMQGRLHSITGLNTTVNVSYEEKKRITFVMNEADKPTIQAAPSPITEGEVIADKPTIKP